MGYKLAPGDASGQNGTAALAAPGQRHAQAAKSNSRSGVWNAVSQSAMEAPSCEESMKEAVAGKSGNTYK